MLSTSTSLSSTTSTPPWALTVQPAYINLSDQPDHINMNTSQSEGSSYDVTMYNIAWILNRMGTPAIIFIGIIGNTISAVVFLVSPLKAVSSSTYLAALSFSDTGFLLSLLFPWLDVLHVRAMHIPGLCQLVIYTTSVFSFLSVWYIVSFTVERYIAVCYPLKRPYLCTPSRAKIVVVGLALFSAVAYSYTLWTSTVITSSEDGKPYCYPKSGWTNFLTVAGNIDSVVTLMIPFLAIVILNIRIVFALIYSFADQRKERHVFSRPLNSSSSSKKKERGGGEDEDVEHQVVASTNSAILQRNKAQSKITKMLVLVSTAFLILNLPSHVLRIYMHFKTWKGEGHKVSTSTIQWQQIAQVIYYLNFSINYFLYSLSGKNFRTNMWSVFCDRKGSRSSNMGDINCSQATTVTIYKPGGGTNSPLLNHYQTSSTKTATSLV